MFSMLDVPRESKEVMVTTALENAVREVLIENVGKHDAADLARIIAARLFERQLVNRNGSACVPDVAHAPQQRRVR